MRPLIAVLVIVVAASGCGGFLANQVANSLRPEQTLPYYLNRYGEPDDWFKTSDSQGTRYLSLTWNCTPRYVHIWFRHIKDDPELPFGAVWMVDRASSGAGICD